MRIFFVIGFCFGFQYLLFAQVDFSADSLLLNQCIVKSENCGYVNNQHLHYKHRTIFKLALGFYKEALSEQISANCEFKPTCSTFSWLAMDEFGVVKALLLTADRLTRCNGNATAETFPYLFRPEDAKIMDYPYRYKFFK